MYDRVAEAGVGFPFGFVCWLEVNVAWTTVRGSVARVNTRASSVSTARGGSIGWLLGPWRVVGDVGVGPKDAVGVGVGVGVGALSFVLGHGFWRRAQVGVLKNSRRSFWLGGFRVMGGGVGDWLLEVVV